MKKALIILLAILAVAGMLASCERTENALAEQLRGEVEWYDYTTRIEVTHAYGDKYVLVATHVYDEELVGIDVWITVYQSYKDEYEFINLYNGGQIN